MKGAVVAAEPVAERDDAEGADLVTARAWENHSKCRACRRRERLGLGAEPSFRRRHGGIQSRASFFYAKIVICPKA